jgi:hypothetical protein
MSVEKLKLGFEYRIRGTRGDIVLFDEEKKNMVPYEGANYIITAALLGGAPNTAWFLGLYEGDFTATLTTTMATFIPAAIESSAYTSTTRLPWVPGAVASGAVNSATEAAFTMNAAKTIYGGFMAASQIKLSTASPLLSVVRFDSPKILEVGDVLHVSASLQLISI